MKKFFVFFLVVCFITFFIGINETRAQEEGEFSSIFYLVAGSYIEKENALEHQKRLYEHRYYSRLMGYPIDGVLYWRVVVDQDEEKERLLEMKELLAEDGFSSFIALDSPGEERPVKDPEPIPIVEPEPEPEPEPENKEIVKFIQELISWLQEKLDEY